MRENEHWSTRTHTNTRNTKNKTNYRTEKWMKYIIRLIGDKIYQFNLMILRQIYFGWYYMLGLLVGWLTIFLLGIFLGAQISHTCVGTYSNNFGFLVSALCRRSKTTIAYRINSMSTGFVCKFGIFGMGWDGDLMIVACDVHDIVYTHGFFRTYQLFVLVLEVLCRRPIQLLHRHSLHQHGFVLDVSV